MQAVILAAGEGKRCRPLTLTRPKPLLKVANKPIIQHDLDALSEAGIKEVIIVTGYLGEKIKSYFGERFKDIKITYVKQGNGYGTAHALLSARDAVEKTFLVLNGDDIYFPEDIGRMVGENPRVLVKEVNDVSKFGEVAVKNGKLLRITEKPQGRKNGWANTGCYVLTDEIFDVIKHLHKSERGEYELTDAVNALASTIDMEVVEARVWQPVTYPWNLLDANELLLNSTENDARKNVEIEENVTLKGKVIIGENTRIRSGTYIEGPCIIGSNCDIGPNCYIRAYTAIGNNCRIGNAVEIKNSVIFDNSKISHLSYVGDSVIGENCNLGAGTMVANLRHDRKAVSVLINGKLIDSDRRKLGVIMADGCKTGIHTSIKPGMVMGPFSWTSPHSYVDRNLEPFTLLAEKKKIRMEKRRIIPCIDEPQRTDAEKLYERLETAV